MVRAHGRRAGTSDFDSVSTATAIIGTRNISLNVGEQQKLETIDVDDAGWEGGGCFIKPTGSVGTTATEILDLPNVGELEGAAKVYGKDEVSGDYFVDLVGLAGANADQTILSEYGTPATRTYTRGTSNNLELTMGSSSYLIICTGDLFRWL